MKMMKLQRLLGFFAVVLVLAGSGVALFFTLPKASGDILGNADYPPEFRAGYTSLVKSAHRLEYKQAKANTQVVSPRQLDLMLSQIQIDASSGHLHQAQSDMKQMRVSLANWGLELGGGPASNSGASGGVTIPIVLYHYTPPDFEQQLEHLEQTGYTVIDMDQALAGMHGGTLPSKPVVLTFDDGFANQARAFELLKKHHMKATFYIIASGSASQWCIGAGRRYHDPAQPPKGCGDAYMNWDEVRQLDASGLITIGGHTFNHRNLAMLSPAEQRFEIVESKAAIERELGHPITHFAYPYGAHNDTSIQLARQAGYLTAVTVEPGTYQPPGSEFTLRRIRDTLSLP